MASEKINVDTPATRFNQSFVNLTKMDSTVYPATTSVRIDNTMTIPLTSYYVYDQYAFRTIAIALT